jgi:hypothetical protein
VLLTLCRLTWIIEDIDKSLLDLGGRFRRQFAHAKPNGSVSHLPHHPGCPSSNCLASRISHHELERVLRGELAAIEWRLAMKIARFHKKTDILNLFPVKVGEYAELRVNEQPPSHPEGVLKKAGKRVLHTMGFGTGVTGVRWRFLPEVASVTDRNAISGRSRSKRSFVVDALRVAWKYKNRLQNVT